MYCVKYCGLALTLPCGKRYVDDRQYALLQAKNQSQIDRLNMPYVLTRHPKAPGKIPNELVFINGVCYSCDLLYGRSEQ